MLGSPPPPRAAMMIARLSLLHSLPRFASMAPFLCLIVAQWDWPDIGCSSVSSSRSGRRHATQLLLDLPGPAVRLAAGPLLVQRQRLLPRLGRLLGLLLPVVHVAEVVPDDRVVLAQGQERRL